jgi:Flp pilus assembly protein TadD
MSVRRWSLALMAAVLSMQFATAVIASEDIVAKGYRWLEAGVPAAAISEFDRALSRDPRNFKAHEGLAIAYSRLGNHNQARWHVDQRHVLGPENPKWQRQRIMVLFADRSYRTEALAEAAQMAREQPHDVQNLILVSRLLSWAEKYAEARQVVERTLKEYPNNVDALQTLATIETVSYNYAKAYQLLKRAAALRPDDGKLQSDFAKSLVIAERFRSVRYEPTMAIVFSVIGLSIVIGQASSRYTARTYALVFIVMLLSTATSLVWLYLVRLYF